MVQYNFLGPEASVLSLSVCTHNHAHLSTLLEFNEDLTILTALDESEDIPMYLHLNNIVPETGWLLNNRNLFLTALETGESKIKVSADSGSAEPASWFMDGHLFSVTS